MISTAFWQACREIIPEHIGKSSLIPQTAEELIGSMWSTDVRSPPEKTVSTISSIDPHDLKLIHFFMKLHIQCIKGSFYQDSCFLNFFLSYLILISKINFDKKNKNPFLLSSMKTQHKFTSSQAHIYSFLSANKSSLRGLLKIWLWLPLRETPVAELATNKGAK